ncbi:hypothetical protein FDP41_012646 [Naegleria fowleri]|uniref:Uncharacterized protein n=1 Tax=Naegleria fowleri TaxID=5763 RepID=A0A6A5C4R7_NAEFO|nr:uncharacterized protein FDP41_012646 [Naegleria fowleri]KAF0980858.1 hypothetical protein FDP41_012646 [Naegleria fowleri]
MTINDSCSCLFIPLRESSLKKLPQQQHSVVVSNMSQPNQAPTQQRCFLLSFRLPLLTLVFLYTYSFTPPASHHCEVV